MPELSIITTAYNAEDFIRESIESVLAQTFKDYEHIIVNDGCTDNTFNIVKEYSNLKHIKILENQYNEGVPYSRNFALSKAEGKYIAIHDADDISLPERMEEEVDFLRSNPELTFIGSHAIKISCNGAVIGNMSYPPEDTFGGFSSIIKYKLNPIIDPSCMFVKDDIINNGGYSFNENYKTAQDFELWCRLLVRGFKMSNIQKPLIKYRINPNGVTQTKRQEQVEATDLIWSQFRRKNFPEFNFKFNIYD